MLTLRYELSGFFRILERSVLRNEGGPLNPKRLIGPSGDVQSSTSFTAKWTKSICLVKARVLPTSWAAHNASNDFRVTMSHASSDAAPARDSEASARIARY